jgi:hypothetical protein
VRSILISFIFLLSSTVNALEIPANLLESELDDVTRILGFNTSTKFLSNPYPLGGYTGLEVGVSLEIINIEELSLLGAQTNPQSEFRFNRISVGKGLFNNLDGYIHFVPYSKSNQVSEYGGLMKWTFFEATYLPFSISSLLHLNTINIEDSFVNQSVGGDFMFGVNVKRFALYFGGGYVRSRSLFTSNILDGSVPLTPEQTYKDTFTSSHSFVGVHIKIWQLFLAGQIDKYQDPVYSVKLGYRL